MKTSIYSVSAVACLVAALAMPVNAAQAGILRDAAKAAAGKLAGGKGTLKKGAKDAVWLAKCGVKVLRRKPCIEINVPKF